MDNLDILIESTEQLELQEYSPSWKEQSNYTLYRKSKQKVVHIAITEENIVQIHQHGISSLDEIGGALIGQAYSWNKQIFVEILHTIPCHKTLASHAHLTFTTETWRELLHERDRLFPEQIIVGWYHSHPRMGIFLSDMDLFIQQHFFQSPWHVAIVVNAQDSSIGFFGWEQEQIIPLRELYLLPSESTKERVVLHQKQQEFTYTYKPE